MNALSRPLPGKRLRTIASAQTIPKTVFTGTAMAVMISVSLNAWIVSGVRQRVPGGREAVLERPPEDDRERADEDDREVEERDAQPEARASTPSVVPRREVTDRADREQRRRTRCTSRTTATAAAPAESPLSIRPKM